MRSGCTTAIALLLLATVLTPAGDALSKALARDMAPVAIVFLRYLLGGLIALPVAALRGERLRPERRDLPRLVLSSALVVGAMTLLVAGLARAPLAEAVGAFLIAPLVAVMLNALGERRWPPPRQLAGALLGLAGAVLILQPEGRLGTGVLLALAGGVLLGAFLACNSRRGHAERAGTALAAQQCLVGALLLLPLALPVLRWPEAGEWPLVAGLAGVTAATHLLTVAAYRRGTPAILAPFFYFNLVAALALGWLLFAEVPGPVALAGLGCILTGGVLAALPRRPHPRQPRRPPLTPGSLPHRI